MALISWNSRINTFYTVLYRYPRPTFISRILISLINFNEIQFNYVHMHLGL